MYTVHTPSLNVRPESSTDSNPVAPFVSGIHFPSDWKVLLTKDQIMPHIKQCAAVLNEKFANQKTILVCILKGAAWFLTSLTEHLTIEYSTYFLEASSYKDGQNQGQIQILNKIYPEKFADRKVILIDELYDKGTTIESVKKHIQTETGILDVFTCTLFKKDLAYPYNYPGRLDYHAIVVPNVWLVGWGLDDRQEKRGWPHLFAVPKTSGADKTVADHVIFESDSIFANWTLD